MTRYKLCATLGIRILVLPLVAFYLLVPAAFAGGYGDTLEVPSYAHIQVPTQHPSLFFTENDIQAIQKRSDSLPWLREVKAEIRKKADRYMGIPTQPYSLTSTENHMGTAGRALQNWLGTLGFAAYLFDDNKYLQKAKEILLAVTEQTEPNNRAHWQKHLQVSDATQGMVLGYDLVYPILSPQERELVLDEIEKFAKELAAHPTTWGMDAPGVLSCNHNSVHHGALGLAALALWHRDLKDKSYWLYRAISRVDGYLANFIDRTGYGTEGHHYYAYGLGGATVFAYALKQVGGEDLMSKHTTVALAADQLLWKLLPFEGRMLSLNDNNETLVDVAGVSGSLIYGKGTQLWAWLESVEASGRKNWLAGHPATTYTAMFLFLWGDKAVEPIPPKVAGTPLGHHFESGRVFLRNEWQDENAAHFSLTSGYDFHRGHDHQDENSFTFYALGEGFIIDPQYMANRSFAHSTLTVNGAEQIIGGDGRIADYREDQHGALVRGQAEEAYEFEPDFIGMVDRKAYFIREPNPYLVLRDDMRMEHDRDGTYTTRYITYPKNKLKQDGKSLTIQGMRGKASVKLMVFSEGKQIKVTEDDLENKTFRRRGTDIPFHKYLRRASATVVKDNPKFVTLVLPYIKEQDLPKVDVSYDKVTGDQTITVNYKGKYKDTFHASVKNITHTRTAL